MIENINKIVVDGLQAATGCPVIKNNTAGKRPAYPFLTFTITSAAIPRKGTFADLGGEYRREARQVWSITAQSDQDNQALDLAVAASDWLCQGGRLYLIDNGVIVQGTGDISNRDTVLNTGYEYRYGFDVTFTVEDVIEKPAHETAEIIETAEVLPQTGEKYDQ